jgi:hypothetical protein
MEAIESWSACEQLMRATLIPAWISASKTTGFLQAGPIVAIIFVLVIR